MALESQRALHEDLERLEDAITSRYLTPPTNIKEERATDHEVAEFLNRVQAQSARLKSVYADSEGARQAEVQRTGTGDTFAAFYDSYNELRNYHKRYPGVPAENLEKVYQRKPPTGDGSSVLERVGQMFSGEEAMGKYFDLVEHHERYLNLKGVKGNRRLHYLQYVDSFDTFHLYPIDRTHKLSDEYWNYVNLLAEYLEHFFKRTRPLEDWARVAGSWDKQFDDEWNDNKVKGWGQNEVDDDMQMSGVDEQQGQVNGLWCRYCEKSFQNNNVYENHLQGRRHKNAVKRQQEEQGNANGTHGTQSKKVANVQSTKERVVAAREFRVRRLAQSMQTERQNTRVNVERRAGMTERERQQEIEALIEEEYGEEYKADQAIGENEDAEEEERHANPLKLPISWDGKPIPFWLYKLHGLGVEYACEICGGYVYAGRRAFEKHFSEPRHSYGLKCLGIQNGNLFREITKIDDAKRLNTKAQQEDKDERQRTKANVEEMEDSNGNVMPKTVYEDLRKQGLI